MKFLFTPDIFKYEEEFILEADSIHEIFEKVNEEMSCNCVLAMYCIEERGLIYIGLLELSEGEHPHFIDDTVQVHDGGADE